MLHSNNQEVCLGFTLTLGKCQTPSSTPGQDTWTVPEAPRAFKSQTRLMQIRSPHTGLSSEMLPIRYQ